MMEKKRIIENDKRKIEAVIVELDEKKNEALNATWQKVNRSARSGCGSRHDDDDNVDDDIVVVLAHTYIDPLRVQGFWFDLLHAAPRYEGQVGTSGRKDRSGWIGNEGRLWQCLEGEPERIERWSKVCMSGQSGARGMESYLAI